MPKAGDEARTMAEKYRILAEIGNRVDRHRYAGMAGWWDKRAAELDAAEQTPALSGSKPDA
jgi:hypothetical protein